MTKGICGPTWISDGSPLPDPHGYGERAIQFITRLRHPKSRAPGHHFELAEFQERIVRRVYGDTDESGMRRIKTVFCLLPRGARKTALGAALGLLHTIGPERVHAGQAVSAAADQKQARIAFDEAAAIIGLDPTLSRVSHVADFRNRITHRRTGAKYEALSSDGGTQHGRTPDFVLADELHAWKKRDLWDALRTGLTKAQGSLLWIITTAGRGQENLCWDMYSYARKVQTGEIEDPAYLPVMFEASRDDDWRDEEVWHAVNPGLKDGFPDIAGLRQLAREAENRPADREAFRQYHLNVWLDHSADPFIALNVYDRGAGPVDLDELEGEPCWIGVDLSSNQDLTAIVACWRDEDGRYLIHPWFYCPAENLRRRSERDGVPYQEWERRGFIEPTQGDTVDYRYIEEQIRDLCERFRVQEIAFDPYLAQQTMTRLGEDGYPVVSFRQGWSSMSPAIHELERAILGGKFRHGGHPVLRWCFANVATKTDTSGNKSFHKGKSTDRIDGAVACAMAVARAASDGGGPCVYADEAERPAGLLFV